MNLMMGLVYYPKLAFRIIGIDANALWPWTICALAKIIQMIPNAYRLPVSIHFKKAILPYTTIRLSKHVNAKSTCKSGEIFWYRMRQYGFTPLVNNNPIRCFSPNGRVTAKSITIVLKWL